MRLALLLSLLSLLTALPVFAQSAPTDIPITVDGKRYTLAERMAFHKVPGCTVVLIKDGKVAWTIYKGDATVGRPVGADTLFPVGSLSYPLIGAAVLRAGANGLVDLDKDINLYLKSWKVPKSPLLKPERGVTIRDLLQNRSGFVYHKYMGYERTASVPTLLQVLNGEKPAVTPPTKLVTEPGTTYNLAMENYVVLQQVAEDFSGKGFDSLMQSLLFAPLGMKNARFLTEPPADLQAKVPIGHDENGKPQAGGWRVYPEVAASGLWTTTGEFSEAMAEILRCLKGKGKFLTPELAAELIKPAGKDLTDDDQQAIGFGITIWDGVKVLFRGGNPEGYYCQMYANPEKANACIIFTNRDLCWKFTSEIVTALDWK